MSPELLRDKVAIVTGGAGGIGEATSRRLVEEGASVVVNDVDGERLDRLVADLRSIRDGVVGVVGDVRDPETVVHLADVASAVDQGRIHVLVNNVGEYRPPGRFLKTDATRWSDGYSMNLEHVFACTRAIAPLIVAGGGGSIVNVSTVEAFRGIPANAVYNAFKAGVNAFTKSLAVELGPDGVRVNAIAPDLIETLQTPRDAMLAGRDPSLIRQWLPLGRFGTPRDCADVVVFLASDLARFVTGHVIPVDGGTTAASGWYGRADGRGWTNLPTSP